MWSVVRYSHGTRGDNSSRPSVQVEVFKTEDEARLRAFHYIAGGQYMLRHNLFITKVEGA